MQVEKQQLFREAGCTGAEFSLSFGKLGRRRFRENCRDLKMHFLAPASLSSQEISPIMKTMFVPNGMPDGFWDIRFSLTTQVKHIWTTLVTFPAEGSFEVGQSSLLRERLNELAKFESTFKTIHFGKIHNQNLKAVGHSFQKIYPVPWSPNAL